MSSLTRTIFSADGAAPASAIATNNAIVCMKLWYPPPPMSHGTFWYGYYFH